jgi:hypothetical protein
MDESGSSSIHPAKSNSAAAPGIALSERGKENGQQKPTGREAQMGRSDVYVKIHQLSDAQLIKLLQFQSDDDGEPDSLSVMVEEEIARRKAGGGRLQ